MAWFAPSWRRAVALLLLLVGLLLTGGAFAEDASGASNGAAYTFDAAEAIDLVAKSMTEAFRQAIVDPQSGVKLVYYMATIGIAFFGIRMGLGQGDMLEFFVDTVKLMAVGSIALAAIKPMEFAAPYLGGSMTLGEFIRDGFYKVASLGDNPIREAAGAWMEIIVKLVNVPLIPDNVRGSNWISALSWMIANIIPLLGCIVFLALSVCAVAVCAALSLGHILAASLLMDLAIALSPVLVPWIMFRPMNFLFDAWMRSLISGGMLVLVGKVFMLAGNKFASTMTCMLASGVNGAQSLVGTSCPANTGAGVAQGGFFAPWTVMVAFGGVFLACLLFVVIAMKLDGFARSMVSGSGISGISMGEFRNAIAGTGAAGRTAGAPATAAGSLAQGVAAARAGLDATRHASKAQVAAGGKPLTMRQRAQTFSAASGAYNQARRGGARAQIAYTRAVQAGAARAKIR